MSRRPPPDPDETAAIVANYQAGASLNALCRRYRRGMPTIHRILTAAGETWNPAHAFTSPASRMQVASRLAERYHNEPVSIQQLAHTIGMSYSATRDLLKAGGAKLRPPRQSTTAMTRQQRAEAATKAAHLYADGKTLAAAAAATGVSVRAVREAIITAGGTIRRKGPNNA